MRGMGGTETTAYKDSGTREDFGPSPARSWSQRAIQLSAPGYESGGEGEDERRIEVLASGLPLFHGDQLAVDITLRGAVTSNGEPRPGSARVDGVCERARADKETKYAELLAGDLCRLVVVALERGGR